MNFTDATDEFSYELKLNRGQLEAAKSQPGRFSEITIQLSVDGQQVVLPSGFDVSALVPVDDPKVAGDQSAVPFTQIVAWDGKDADGAPMTGLLEAAESIGLTYYPGGERAHVGTPFTSSFQITNTDDVEP
jgi:hypothetical protein